MCSMPRIEIPSTQEFFKILKSKYACWDSIHYNIETADELNNFIGKIQVAIDENLVDIKKEEFDVEIRSNNVSCPDYNEQYLSSELQVFEDENIRIDSDLESLNEPSFTGFSSFNTDYKPTVSITPHEFWYDEESPSTDKEF